MSPQASIGYRVQPEKTLYATVGRGYKAGGFNPASPVGGEAYGEEFSWNVEGGVKTLLAGGRVSANATVFYIDWDDLQLNIPNPAVPAQFYIANVGGAVSKGVELEIGARAAPGVDLFTSVGYTHARFAEGSISSGVNVEGNKIPNTPEYTASAGVQYSRVVGPATILGRADAVFYGVVPVQRPEFAWTGGVLARQPPPRGDGPIPDGRAAHSERLRHQVHSAGVPVSELRAIRLHGRDGRSSHRQRERGPAILRIAVPRARLPFSSYPPPPTRPPS